VGHPRSAWLRTIDDDVQSQNFGSPYGVEEGKGQGGLATSHQYGNALLGVCYATKKNCSVASTCN